MRSIERGQAPSPDSLRSSSHAHALGKLAARLALVVILHAACTRPPPPAPPGEPIPAPAEVTLGTMEVECDALLTALGHYKQCPNLDEYDRSDIAGWIEHAEQGFAAGKKANPDPQSRTAIAAACRKAVASVTAATERCRAGPRPRR